VAFSLSDFKKTSRTANKRHVLYPHQLRDDRFLAAISYAIDYYERMVGRPRHELETATLMEFFGDPKLARGIVACLSRSYVWHEPTFAEVLPPAVWAWLQAAGWSSPARLRGVLYRYVNEHHDGFLLPRERAGALATLCADMPIDPPMFERLLTLDAPGEAILTKVAGTPDARDIVTLYNYHSLETPLRYAETLRLTLRGSLWSTLRTVHNIARRYGLQYDVEHDGAGIFAREATITWRGTRDALGSYRGSGRRIVRALLRLLAAHPDALVEGEALVHLRGKASVVVLDKRALRTLGVHTTNTGSVEAWDTDEADEWRTAWTRAFVRGETGGWRLRRDPEPLVTDKGIIVPDYGLQRGTQRAALVLAPNASAVDALLKPLQALGGRSLVVAATPPALAQRLVKLPVIVLPSEGTPSPRLLTSALPSPTATAEQHTTKWQRLDQVLAAEGYVDEARIAEILEVEASQVGETMRGWRKNDVTYIPGVGLCTAETVTEIRSLLQPERRKAA
jgi:predicted nuclease of restriction endonuclease-like RecB superfamily